MPTQKYICIKCGNLEYNMGESRTTGGLFSKIFDIQTNKFITVECKNFGYTEFYKKKTPVGENVVDFLFGGMYI